MSTGPTEPLVLLPWDVEYLTLIANPFEHDDGMGRRFMANAIVVRVREEFALATVSGPSILKDGGEGKRRIHSWYVLRDVNPQHQPAPPWLVEVLRESGVRW